MPLNPTLSPDHIDNQGPNDYGLDNRQQMVINNLGFDPVSIDTLMARTDFKLDDLSTILLTLELAGLVATEPRGMYTRLPMK